MAKVDIPLYLPEKPALDELIKQVMRRGIVVEEIGTGRKFKVSLGHPGSLPEKPSEQPADGPIVRTW